MAPRKKTLPQHWTHGYLHPDEDCPHEPRCHTGSGRCLPQPKQALAHASPAEVMFYGGAVGGGKTEYALIEAIQIAIENKGVKVGIFRRKRTELKLDIIGRFLVLVPDFIAKYNASEMVATFFNGSQIWFCHCQHEKDVYTYQGIQFVAVFFDEASQATEFIINYLLTRIRSARLGMRKRLRLTSNPGGVGHGWLKRWFLRIDPQELRLPGGGMRVPPVPFEVWRPHPKDGNPTPPERMPSRQFIPAWFKDNAALVAADPDYLAKVYALGGSKAKQLAEGDWDANDDMILGGLFKTQHVVSESDTLMVSQGLTPGRVIPWHVFPDRSWKPPVGSYIYGSVDYGFGAPWAFHLHAVLADGRTRTFYEKYGPKIRDVEQAKHVKWALETLTFADGKTPLMEGLQWIVYEPVMGQSRMEQGLAKSVIEVYKDAMPRVHFQLGVATRNTRVSRPNRWMDALSPGPDGFPWWSCTTACPDLIRTVPEIPWDPDDPEVEHPDSENHCYEGVGRFFEARPHAPRKAQVDLYRHLDPISAAHHKARAESERSAAIQALNLTGMVGP